MKEQIALVKQQMVNLEQQLEEKQQRHEEKIQILDEAIRAVEQQNSSLAGPPSHPAPSNMTAPAAQQEGQGIVLTPQTATKFREMMNAYMIAAQSTDPKQLSA
eukprot:8493068-Karenia_brevis.AAC.1